MMCVKKCGCCCSWLFLNGNPTGDLKILLEMRGAKFFKDCYALPVKCKHLATDNLCNIYLSRPRVCKLFNCKKFAFKEELADIQKNSL